MQAQFGLLNVFKPRGITSRAVVNQIHRLVRPNKAGHAGTLDPLAEGVLVICVGAATRLIEFVQRMPKRYVGTFLLGKDSETQDVDSDVVDLRNAAKPTREQIEAAISSFIGEVKQTPPAYSALKVGGKRAYALARAGQHVELKARTVTVHEIKVLSYEDPKLVLDVRCGSGTYIRTLGRDIAIAVGSCAVMSALTRTAIGDFDIDKAWRLDSINQQSISDCLLSPCQAVSQLPFVQLSEDEVRCIANGVSIDNRFSVNEREIATFDPAGCLVAILTPRGQHALGPIRNFPRNVQSTT
ncbi:MAG: tRNA pseudouridine(55) synthase TruB [Planctomycetes bacterium]|nr:tRNA pseudouridine(55) synthase TruB [Planctomycetota bacterium]